LLPIMVLFTLFDAEPKALKWITEDWMTGLIRALEKIQEEPWILFKIASFLLSFLPPIYMYRAHYHERLFLTQVGMRYQSPLPLFLQWIKPDWLIKWSQIKIAYLKPEKLGRGPLAMTLVIETASQRRQIKPCAWVDPNAPEDVPSVFILANVYAATNQACFAILSRDGVFQQNERYRSNGTS